MRILNLYFAVGDSDGMAMYNGRNPVSNLCIKSQTFQFPAPESKEGKTWSDCVKTDVNKCRLTGVDLEPTYNLLPAP